MRIIIDGNDGVGKTTLAKRLQQDLNIKSYIHLSWNDLRSYKFYKSIMKKRNVIFDRSFMDELIYSEVLKRKPKLSKRQDKLLHKQIFKDGIFVIICTSSEKIYTKNERFEIIEHSESIDDYFKHITLKYNYLTFDTRYDSYETLLKILNKYKLNSEENKNV